MSLGQNPPGVRGKNAQTQPDDPKWFGPKQLGAPTIECRRMNNNWGIPGLEEIRNRCAEMVQRRRRTLSGKKKWAVRTMGHRQYGEKESGRKVVVRRAPDDLSASAACAVTRSGPLKLGPPPTGGTTK